MRTNNPNRTPDLSWDACMAAFRTATPVEHDAIRDAAVDNILNTRPSEADGCGISSSDINHTVYEMARYYATHHARQATAAELVQLLAGW